MRKKSLKMLFCAGGEVKIVNHSKSLNDKQAYQLLFVWRNPQMLYPPDSAEQ